MLHVDYVLRESYQIIEFLCTIFTVCIYVRISTIFFMLLTMLVPYLQYVAFTVTEKPPYHPSILLRNNNFKYVDLKSLKNGRRNVFNNTRSANETLTSFELNVGDALRQRGRGITRSL